MVAVLGASGSLHLLERLAGLTQAGFQAALTTLLDHRVIELQGNQPHQAFAFTHALLRDAAYNALTRTKHRVLHHRVALALIQDQADLPTPPPLEILAYHWTEAGEHEAAIAAWQRAGDEFASRRAFREAEQAFTQALCVLQAARPRLQARPRASRRNSAWSASSPNSPASPTATRPRAPSRSPPAPANWP